MAGTRSDAKGMDTHLVGFTRALRGAGLRVSPAEAADAARATLHVGLGERDAFRLALRATLVKDVADAPTFDALFPVYFGGEGPGLEDVLATLAPEGREAAEALSSELGRRLRRLLEWLLSGEGPDPDALAGRARRAVDEQRPGRQSQARLTQRLLRELGFRELENVLERLRELLLEAGLSDDDADQAIAAAARNAERMADEVGRQAGAALAEERAGDPRPGSAESLADVPIARLSQAEAAQLRREVTRMVARLRSRAALRQRRAASGTVDPRATLRARQPAGGGPVTLGRRRRRRKPSLVVICDVSTSMRPYAELMLRLIYELHDQVARARSFAFNDDLVEVTPILRGRRPAEAVTEVLTNIPPGYYATDLGRSLATFEGRHAAAVDRRTTVIVLGDGRNNLRPPRAELLAGIAGRARRLLWLNPEPRHEWGLGDSDMLLYAPLCAETLCVGTLRELTAAVDQLLGS